MLRISNILIIIVGLFLGATVFPIKDAYSLVTSLEDNAEYNGPTEVFVFDEPFHIPVVINGVQKEIVQIQLALEIKDGAQNRMPHIAPRLRHEILSTLFEHYHKGHFSSSYMQKETVENLMQDLNVVTALGSNHIVQSVLLQSMRKQAL